MGEWLRAMGMSGVICKGVPCGSRTTGSTKDLETTIDRNQTQVPLSVYA
jgi:hypothetical protein